MLFRAMSLFTCPISFRGDVFNQCNMQRLEHCNSLLNDLGCHYLHIDFYVAASWAVEFLLCIVLCLYINYIVVR